MVAESRTFSNRLLARVNRADMSLLEPHLEPIDLPLRMHLEMRNRRISHAFFLEDGIASVVATGAKDTSIEVGIIGSEGVTALTVVMGRERAAHATFMQVAGKGWSAAWKIDPVAGWTASNTDP